jgi:hypothetical protein
MKERERRTLAIKYAKDKLIEVAYWLHCASDESSKKKEDRYLACAEYLASQISFTLRQEL